MLRHAYLVIGGLVLGSYAAVAMSGYEFGRPKIQRIPASVRQAAAQRSGSSSSWFSGGGFRGGK